MTPKDAESRMRTQSPQLQRLSTKPQQRLCNPRTVPARSWPYCVPEWLTVTTFLAPSPHPGISCCGLNHAGADCTSHIRSGLVRSEPKHQRLWYGVLKTAEPQSSLRL